MGAGDFIVDDDGSGYADVGEEEDWTAEPGVEADDEQQAVKRQKTADAKKGALMYTIIVEPLTHVAVLYGGITARTCSIAWLM